MISQRVKNEVFLHITNLIFINKYKVSKKRAPMYSGNSLKKDNLEINVSLIPKYDKQRLLEKVCFFMLPYRV